MRSALLLLGGMLLMTSGSVAAEDPRKKPATTWDVVLAGPEEPGERFEMSGRVRNRAGDELPFTKVYVYHADVRGQYAEKDGPFRLASTLLTDAGGRYRVRSVFPGTYGYPAHVHFEILQPAL